MSLDFNKPVILDIRHKSDYLFKLTIPHTDSHELVGVVTYRRVTDNIIRYVEKFINSTSFNKMDIDVNRNKHIGMLIENSIYDVFTAIEDIDYDAGDLRTFGLTHDDVDEYIANNGESFRQELFVFTNIILSSCLKELSRIDLSFSEFGRPIETYVLSRNQLDPNTLEVRGYLAQIK